MSRYYDDFVNVVACAWCRLFVLDDTQAKMMHLTRCQHYKNGQREHRA